MRKLSTGQDSTLGSYLKLAPFIGPKAEAFIKEKIIESPNGENEEVIADEGQMMYLLVSIEHSPNGDKAK